MHTKSIKGFQKVQALYNDRCFSSPFWQGFFKFFEVCLYSTSLLSLLYAFSGLLISIPCGHLGPCRVSGRLIDFLERDLRDLALLWILCMKTMFCISRCKNNDKRDLHFLFNYDHELVEGCQFRADQIREIGGTDSQIIEEMRANKLSDWELEMVLASPLKRNVYYTTLFYCRLFHRTLFTMTAILLFALLINTLFVADKMFIVEG
ncbi:unnamed protein product [Bursaphelenchus xylophilus]|uniref:(pine wood nematode) hypothetical protein n=1 Tax=Bursaphelenchus xylophilus TaxID=6326 RepID=A0A7I8WXW6_BURXY|nr:unnamed protein product [Bursaphelenchus xylophilus]CAG9100401.1 unnamed protein product [Bursaphelenchus xylophilus]